ESSSRAALRPDDSLMPSESPSARTRGLRPASPALALRLSPTVSPARGRFPQEAMSEGAWVVTSFAPRILRVSDQRRPGGRSGRPGRSVPLREADPSRAALRRNALCLITATGAAGKPAGARTSGRHWSAEGAPDRRARSGTRPRAAPSRRSRLASPRSAAPHRNVSGAPPDPPAAPRPHPPAPKRTAAGSGPLLPARAPAPEAPPESIRKRRRPRPRPGAAFEKRGRSRDPATRS